MKRARNAYQKWKTKKKESSGLVDLLLLWTFSSSFDAWMRERERHIRGNRMEIRWEIMVCPPGEIIEPFISRGVIFALCFLLTTLFFFFGR